MFITYPHNFEQKIGFGTVRGELTRLCVSQLGRDEVDALRFSSRHDEVEEWLRSTDEFVRLLQGKREFPLNHFHDMRSALRAIALPGSFLTEAQLFDLQRSLQTAGEIARFFSTKDEDETPPYPVLAAMSREIAHYPDIMGECDRVLDKNGNIRDNASPQLLDLRRSAASLAASINSIMRRVITQGRHQGFLDKDVTPSVRDGRLVLPVSPMHKRKLRGIVHDESATGKTVFIEPEEIVEANNRIRETESEIKREIVRILTAATDVVRPHIDSLLDTYAAMGRFDFIRAKALFALDVGGAMPHLEAEPHIEWFHAVHPGLLLSLREQGKEVVPLDISLDSRERLLLISGPNAGGKSVCLKTVGIVQYMMQCGILPPLYDNSHMGLFKRVFIDIGDQQSLEDDLSTYSSHLLNMKTFMQQGDKDTLVLIDEFGSGTEPQIGGAIAQAILEQLNERQVFGVITTHYQNLKHFAQDTPGIVNGAMLYDRQKMQPLFQLSMGYPGSSFAIEIAHKIGLPKTVIDTAREIVGSDYVNMDRYLLDIVRDRRYWERKRTEIHAREKKLNAIVDEYNERLEKIAKEHRDIVREAKSEAREILKQSNARIEQAIKEIREMQAEKEKTRQVRQQLSDFKQRLERDDEDSEHLNELKKTAPRVPKAPIKKKEKRAAVDDAGRPISAGDRVLMKGGNTVGEVLEADEKYAVVAFGLMKTRVETERLVRTDRQIHASTAAQQSLSKSTLDDIRERQLRFKPEIDVRGMRGDEAVQAVTYFIDDAIQFTSSRVRILHGTGTGALRDMIRQYLRTVPGVESFHDEDVRLGGAGITVVNLN